MKQFSFYLVINLTVFIICATLILCENEEHFINSNLSILGSTLKTNEGKSFLAFRGIPYAKPPLGERRFKDPEPYGKWDGVLDATNDGNACPQPKDIQNHDFNDVPSLIISEDCLTLNVYTSSMKGNKTVIVFIHGGGLRYGTGNSLQIHPKYFLNEDIVLVTFNYRLGALGFVSSGTKEAPGNYGFKDQVLVLKWVRDNIQDFGGNPNSVTLMGHSAGSMSATLHMVSPMSKNLFHRLIALSGSTVNQWRIHNVNLTKTLAQSVECPSEFSDKMIECLREKSWEKLIEVGAKWDENNLPDMEWNYEIEKDFGQERFITGDPAVLFKNGEFHRLPIIAGITKDEYKDKGRFVVLNTELLNDINDNFNNFAPLLFGYGPSGTVRSNQISNRLRELYFKDQKIETSAELELGNLFSDAIINYGVHRLVQLASKYIDVYYYRLDYKGRYTCSYYNSNGEPYSVHHDDALIYLFDYKKCAPEFHNSDPELIISKKYIKYLTNFATFGDPNTNLNNEDDIICTTNWSPSTKNEIKTFYIDEKCAMDDPPYEDRLAVWDELFPIDGIEN